MKLEYLGIKNVSQIFWNLSPSELVEHSIKKNIATLTSTGALAIDTGKFTGRSPKDKYVVLDQKTKDSVWWGDVNYPIDEMKFDLIYSDMTTFLEGKDIYSRDVAACADNEFKISIRVITEIPWSNLFANNLFLRLTKEELNKFEAEWHILCIPSFKANPEKHGTKADNFTIINFTKKTILIGGSAYTGEIKKGIFTVLNYVLPHEKNVLSMHCSANLGVDNDIAIFFGLSGTGKTTLSADPKRGLIGDDEHGWSANSVFNFEGGCYAKCIDLTQEKEPEIFDAIKFGTIVENTNYFHDSRVVDYANTQKTENTRAAYPINHIANAIEPSMAKGNPKNIFFLTCDAFGVLPPISKLTTEQAMYHFISGYTAKVAGTEVGITEPQLTFSPCFGKAFLPLHPTQYAHLLGEKLNESGAQVWLINTGWSGGSYGIGSRMKLSYTRAMITAVLESKFDKVNFITTPIFGLQVPENCDEVPTELLTPRNTWSDKVAYDKKANELAEAFNTNFRQYADFATDAILSAAPKVLV